MGLEEFIFPVVALMKFILTFMALEEHLRYARYQTEIAVYLERRMIIEQIGEHGMPEERIDILVALLAVPQSCPHIDDPRPGPAGVSSTVRQSSLYRRTGGLKQFILILTVEELPPRIIYNCVLFFLQSVSYHNKYEISLMQLYPVYRLR